MKNVEGYDDIKQSLDNLKEETEKWLKSNFEQWRDQSMASITQGDLTYVIEITCTFNTRFKIWVEPFFEFKLFFFSYNFAFGCFVD